LVDPVRAAVWVDQDEAIVGESDESICPQESAMMQPVLAQATAETQLPPSTFIAPQLEPESVETRTSPVLSPTMQIVDVQATDSKSDFET